MLEAGSGRVERRAASSIRSALAGPDRALDDFLISDELWGGAGSIADSAFESDSRRIKPFQELMIELGRRQIKFGLTNVRTESWVQAFESWRDPELVAGQSIQVKSSDESGFLQKIALARAVRFLIGAIALPGYLVLRIPVWWRRLSKRPLLALLVLGAYVVLVSIGMRWYLKTPLGRLDRSKPAP